METDTSRFIQIEFFLKKSWLGRISAMKMNVLPKLIFVYIQKKKYIERVAETDKSIYMEWQETKNIASKYYKIRKRGGLAVPNIKLYYQAASLVWILDWIENLRQRIAKLESGDLDEGLHNYYGLRNQLKQL